MAENAESGFRTAIIGLGIIGGSLAYALRGFRQGKIIGCDPDTHTLALARKNKAVHEVYTDPREAVKNADLVVLCVYPDLLEKIVKECAPYFKKGAVLTDVCGVKEQVCRQMAAQVPDGVDYVGGHPMAGKEVSGFENASPELFWMSGYIVTPLPGSRPESVELVKEMARYVGATRIAENTPAEHDAIIAYTSDLMHISASALCLSFPEGMNRAYTAGSFRDCTRVANINPTLWTELFLQNRKNILCEIDRLQSSLARLRDAIAEGNSGKLEGLLEQVKNNKKEMQNREV